MAIVSTPVQGVPLSRLPGKLESIMRFIGALFLAAFTFGICLMVLGKNPLTAYQQIFQGALGDSYGWSEVLVKMIPFTLCALATAIPARVRLINVGGDGQLYMGAWAATWVALHDSYFPAATIIPLMVVAGFIGGACWGGIAGVLRSRFNLNETIATLLLNYVASLLVEFYLHGPWKDPGNFNWPYTRQFSDAARLSTLGGTRVTTGIFIALAALIIYAVILYRTRLGYDMRVVGGNPEAAFRHGLSLKWFFVLTLVIGGGLAGIAGMTEVSGIQGRLQPGISNGIGYIGFLVSWLARQNPLLIVLMSALLAIITVGGEVMQININLPSAATNIFMALILFCVLGSQKLKQVEGKSK